MKPEDEKTPQYKWPWFALAAVILFLALAIFWVSLAAIKLRHQRDINSPLPTSAPTR